MKTEKDSVKSTRNDLVQPDIMDSARKVWIGKNLVYTKRASQEYKKLIDESCEVAGEGGPGWNVKFLIALDRRGLRIENQTECNNKENMYPDGKPITAPLPYPNSDAMWSSNDVIVWKDAK